MTTKTASPPLKAHFRHNNGVICCGSLRIAREDFDTNPSEVFKQELLDWICETLNMEISRHERPKRTPAGSDLEDEDDNYFEFTNPNQ